MVKGGTREGIDVKLLTSALVAPAPKAVLVQELVTDITSRSLQSKDELFRVAQYFAVPSDTLTRDPSLLKKIFDARNQIIHEMDIDFSKSSKRGFRRIRSKQVMIKYTTEIFRIGTVFLREVDARL